MSFLWKWAIATCVFIAAGLWILDQRYPLSLPNEDQGFAQVVLDRDGGILRAFADDNGVWRYPIKQTAVSPYYIEALLNYEDRWFYTHPGVNPASLVRAAYQNLQNNRVVSGGSTLTMQVARLLHPHERSLKGKATQILRALQLEFHLNKEEILEIYLNRAPFGGTLEGVASASHAYLQKPPGQLTKSEAALLAVLPQAPSRLRPDRHPARAQRARDKVLNRLLENEIWSTQDVEEAQKETVAGLRLTSPIKAPLLARRLTQELSGQSVIKTTIDARLQNQAQSLLKHYVERLPEKSSAAALIVDNRTAETLAYVGSADFFNTECFGQVDMIRAQRSPGSTLKPFLYGMALDDGLIHSESLLADVPRTEKAYRPANFERGFSGPVSASYALQQSLNVPAVNLLEHFGAHRFYANLRNSSFLLRLPPNAEPNLSLILGGAGTSLESLVSAYMALSNEGRVTPLKFLQPEQQKPKPLMSPGAAWIIRDILRKTPQPGRVVSSLAKKQQSIAWKTGTSYGYRDSWAIGTNDQYTVGVWVGRPDGTPMPGHWGGKTAAPLMFRLFNSLPNLHTQTIRKPDTVKEETICWPLGTALTNQPSHHCHQTREAWTLSQQIPPTLLDRTQAFSENPFAYWINQKTGLRVNGTCNAASRLMKTAALWPSQLEPWIQVSQRGSLAIPSTDPSCNKHLPKPNSKLRISGIEEGARLRSPEPGKWPTINLTAAGGEGTLHWYINGKLSYTTHASGVIVHKFKKSGRQQIIVIDEQGLLDQKYLEVLENE